MDSIDVKSDGTLDVGDLCRMFEASEEATYSARQEAERDRDYVDNKQLTEDELAVLKKRGQPPQIDNRIKTKVDYLVGLEKQQRINPRALPRTPMHEEDAAGASEALRYVADTELFDNKRSGVWRNMLVEGAGGISVSVEEGYDGPEIKLRRIPWDRMFWDPHSAETDFSDASYLGLVIWKDYDDALADYPDKEEELETTLNSAPHSDTYDDKPKWSLWADKKRKRVRICQIWIKRGDQWHFAEYTKGGILKAGPSPYTNDKGESDCELFFQSAYVDRDNNRYGLVREMITLQDGINKRLSKTLHLLNTAQVIYEDGVIDDINLFRREAAKPDGTMMVAPGGLSNKAIEFNTRTDLAEGHFKLLQEAKNSIDLKGPNATQMGDKAQGSSSASGRAILASQQGGMVSLGDLLDNLRHLDIRVFRAIWARIRQFWNGEKWIRVTDDERNVKWVGMNVDPQQIQMAAQQNPQMMEMIQGAVANVAELDCDIIIDEQPDSVIPQMEQFEALVGLKQFDANNEIPFRAIVAASMLKDKHKLLEAMDEGAEQRQQQMPPEMMKVQAEAQLAEKKLQSDAQLAQQKAMIDANNAKQKAELDAHIAEQKALREARLAQMKADAEIQLKREVAAADVEIEQTRADASIQLESKRADNEVDLTHRKLDAEAQKRGELKDKENGSLHKEVKSDLKELAKATVETQGAIAKLADATVQTQQAVVELLKDVTAPTEVTVERDPSGRMTKATRARKREAA